MGCANTVYNFQIGEQAYPDKDSIRIGDTIWIHMQAPTEIIDLKSNKAINYAGAVNLGTAIGFESFINNTIVPGTKAFTFLLLTGKEVQNSNPALYKEYTFNEKRETMFLN